MFVIEEAGPNVRVSIAFVLCCFVLGALRGVKHVTWLALMAEFTRARYCKRA